VKNENFGIILPSDTKVLSQKPIRKMKPLRWHSKLIEVTRNIEQSYLKMCHWKVIDSSAFSYPIGDNARRSSASCTTTMLPATVAHLTQYLLRGPVVSFYVAVARILFHTIQMQVRKLKCVDSAKFCTFMIPVFW